MPQHHPSAPLYSQRKSPFPEAITLGTLGSGRSVTYGLGQDRLQLVFVQQKQQHIWLSSESYGCVVHGVEGGNQPVFSASSSFGPIMSFFATPLT
ncbi:hypothetical protein CgunFtcFv8_021284 [Champsocephalus gunnari]|uniref:Uncharacterized protein n=1 Tax=Champsocephalus gunnari TaxID=52237 RepID=A0AAN8I243_CHAGU|nr:hypothetical protein CgunFtcFv8_021284 [Champsocephalus gunnari]